MKVSEVPFRRPQAGRALMARIYQPQGAGPFPVLLDLHGGAWNNKDRFANEPMDRAVAASGVLVVAIDLTLAPDGLTPLGGYPGNDEDGRALQAKLDQARLRTDMLNSARFLRSHALSTGKLGVTGFCWGGGTANYLAAAMGTELSAAAPYYGVAAETASVPKIKAAILAHLAENDPRINETYPAYEQALKSAGVRYEVHTYPGTQHGFHNNSTPRYDEAAAKLSWERTVAFFKKNLAQSPEGQTPPPS